MKTNKRRKRTLPAGWYPETAGETLKILDKWSDMAGFSGSDGVSAIVPHAGWFFSGFISFSTISRLQKDPDTVVIAGGHLPGGADPVVFNYEELETPLGVIKTDTQLLQELSANNFFTEDMVPDNTVEVQLPIVKYLFPESRVVAFRIGAGKESDKIGKAIYKASERLNKKIIVIGSTDLTHYGPSYGFTPEGTGKSAEKWVKEVNDKRIIDAMLAMEYMKVLDLGNREKSACSSGAAACAISFALEKGVSKGNLIKYSVSSDIYPGESFVGYAGIVY